MNTTPRSIIALLTASASLAPATACAGDDIPNGIFDQRFSVDLIWKF